MALENISQATIVGYIDPLGEGPGFVFPIYCSNNGLYISIIDDNDLIKSFEKICIGGAVLSETRELVGYVDQPALFAFYPGFEDVLVGSRKTLIEKIDGIIDLFEELPFVLRAIHQFAKRPLKAESLLNVAGNFLAKYSQYRAAEWLQSQQLLTSSSAQTQGRANISKVAAQYGYEFDNYLDFDPDGNVRVPLHRNVDFPVDHFNDDESRALSKAENRPDMLVNHPVIGIGQAKTISGFVTVTALIGPRESSVEFAACKIITSPLDSLLWAAPSIVVHGLIRPTVLAFMQSVARGTWLEYAFRGSVQAGLSAGIYRCVTADILPASELGDVFIILAIDLIPDKIYSEKYTGNNASFVGDDFKSMGKFLDKKKKTKNMLLDPSIKERTSDATYAAVQDAMKKSSPYSPPGVFKNKKIRPSNTRH